MFKFKYHPDNVILRNDTCVSFAEFIIAHPGFPITENKFFEYHEDGALDEIVGCSHYKLRTEDYQSLIEAIEALEV